MKDHPKRKELNCWPQGWSRRDGRLSNRAKDKTQKAAQALGGAGTVHRHVTDKQEGKTVTVSTTITEQHGSGGSQSKVTCFSLLWSPKLCVRMTGCGASFCRGTVLKAQIAERKQGDSLGVTL